MSDIVRYKVSGYLIPKVSDIEIYKVSGVVMHVEEGNLKKYSYTLLSDQ